MKDKRIVERLFGRRRKGGWVLQRQQLLEALKKDEALNSITFESGQTSSGGSLACYPTMIVSSEPMAGSKSKLYRGSLGTIMVLARQASGSRNTIIKPYQ